MKWIALFSALLMVLVSITPARADNSITASASDAGSGVIQVSGTVTLDSGSSPYIPSVTVEVWQEGCLVTTFTISLNSDNTFSGNSGFTTFSAGTYSVTAQVLITTSGKTDAYDYLIRGVTVK
jgi:hypothetical protein